MGLYLFNQLKEKHYTTNNYNKNGSVHRSNNV